MIREAEETEEEKSTSGSILKKEQVEESGTRSTFIKNIIMGSNRNIPTDKVSPYVLLKILKIWCIIKALCIEFKNIHRFYMVYWASFCIILFAYNFSENLDRF